MDEVITCKCGYQQWVIGTSGLRCTNCGYWVDDDIVKNIRLDISKINEWIKEQK